MKKFFCDCCGKEFCPSAGSDLTNGSIKTPTKKDILFAVSIDVRATIVGQTAFGKKNADVHADLCFSCKRDAIDEVLNG